MIRFRLFFLIFIIFGFSSAQTPFVIDSVLLDKPLLKGDPFFIWNAAIENDSLCLDVSYVGGQKDHVFKLFAYNRKIQENRFYMDLILSHKSNNDSDQSVVSTTLRFDLSPLKRKYRFSNRLLYLNVYKLKTLHKVQMLTYNF